MKEEAHALTFWVPKMLTEFTLHLHSSGLGHLNMQLMVESTLAPQN